MRLPRDVDFSQARPRFIRLVEIGIDSQPRSGRPENHQNNLGIRRRRALSFIFGGLGHKPKSEPLVTAQRVGPRRDGHTMVFFGRFPCPGGS